MIEIPAEVRDMIKRLKLPRNTARIIRETVDEIERKLDSMGLKHSVKVKTWYDYEYPDWEQIEILFEVETDSYQYAYEVVTPAVDDIVLKHVPTEILDYLLPKVEPCGEGIRKQEEEAKKTMRTMQKLGWITLDKKPLHPV